MTAERNGPAARAPAAARAVAFHVLRHVEAGGHASDLLLERSAALDSRDAGLASEIVFGVLRFRAQLDYLIERIAGKRKLDVEVALALRMAVYQLRYLERIPAHAAVADAVELVKRARKRSAAGFVNATLRRVNRDAVEWPTREIALSCPEWLLARWEARFGREAAEGIARAALSRPEIFVRGPVGALAHEPADIPGCYRLLGPLPDPLPPGLRIQDVGSQSIVPLLGLEPGQTFLDVCAAPGNKTAQAMESGVRAVACDRSHHRLAGLAGLGAELVVADGTRGLPFKRRFDRILLDAPCSGTGTLGRNPEIKWRLRPADLEDLSRRQTALLANARAALAPGGVLVYSTCSLEPEENEQVVAGALVGQTPWSAASPLAGLRPKADGGVGRRPGGLPHFASELLVETMRRIPGRDAGDGFYAAVIKSDIAVND